MPDKDFKTINEQIDILLKRGLAITDRKKAAEFLYHNNYYRISGYSLTLRSHDIFYKGTSFQNIMDIYNFDYELRHILLKYIEVIEVCVKSVYTYEFTKIYGATGYLNPDNFTDSKKHNEILSKVASQKDRRLQHEPYLKHFIVDLREDVPFWAYVDLFTIADISFLFSISPFEIKNAVASSFKLLKAGDKLLESFMHSITIIRNLCAHGSRLYNRLFEQRPWLNKRELNLLIKRNGTVDNNHLYGFILVMKRLLSSKHFADMKVKIVSLTEKYPFVRMKYYGFRDDWKDML